jgi:putative mRNA 3-end processing factor
MNEIREWWAQNKVQGKASVLMGYALGKMQRLVKNLGPFEDNVFAHGAIFNMNEVLRSTGFDLPYIAPVSQVTDKNLFKGALILAPSSAQNSTWMNRFGTYSLANCSGWMAVRGAKNRAAVDRGFVLSDHADWPELHEAIRATGAEKVFVTHGYTATYARWLNEQGIEAAEVKTMYGAGEEDVVPPAGPADETTVTA